MRGDSVANDTTTQGSGIGVGRWGGAATPTDGGSQRLKGIPIH